MPTKAELQQTADALADRAKSAQAEADAAREEAEKPRTADGVFEELLDAIIMHLGNPPKVRELHKELMAMKSAPAAAEAKQASESNAAAVGHTS